MKPSPFLRAGVSGAYFPEILGTDLELRMLFDFPVGYSPFLGEDLLAPARGPPQTGLRAFV